MTPRGLSLRRKARAGAKTKDGQAGWLMWSLCNEEVGTQNTPTGEKVGDTLKAVIKNYDTTRPVTAAQSQGWGKDEGWTGGLVNVVALQRRSGHAEHAGRRESGRYAEGGYQEL